MKAIILQMAKNRYRELSDVEIRDVYERFAHYENPKLRIKLLDTISICVNTPSDVLLSISNELDPNVNPMFFRGATRNKNAPVELLSRKDLINNKDSFIRNGISGNSNTPPDVLKMFLHDKSSEVRAGVAFNHSTPPDMLEWLYHNDKSVKVRKGVAENENTPKHIIDLCLNDDDEGVRWMAQRTTNNDWDKIDHMI